MSTLSSLAALLASVLLLLVGNGLLNSLVPIRGTMEGFAPVNVGIIGSMYFFGMLAGTLAAPLVLRRTGYVRAFCAFVSLSIVATLIMPVFVSPIAWMVLRGVVGFAFAGLYGVIDAWIAVKSKNENRGQVYGAYQIVNFTGSALGQQFLVAAEPNSFMLFSLVAGLFALATLPLAFTRTDEPKQSRASHFNLLWMAKKSPVGVATAFVVGAANGAFWSLAPVYALGIGVGREGAATFLTATVIGSALAVWPVGRFSDQIDRRKAVLVISFIAAIVELFLFAAGMSAASALSFWGLLIGASTMVLYTLAVAHTNDRTGPDYAVTVASGLLFLYCVGAIIAPTIDSYLMSIGGPKFLFAVNAVLHIGLCGFTLWRMLIREQPELQAVVETVTSKAGSGLP
ncbi:MAG: MFS transporter [Hyphomicrobiales bacterium]|nr:MFS transporter [Hyphomicrobiales bacterium]MDE2113980.1 MFS transporter [Hyphomicrobiales bacterium]